MNCITPVTPLGVPCEINIQTNTPSTKYASCGCKTSCSCSKSYSQKMASIGLFGSIQGAINQGIIVLPLGAGADGVVNSGSVTGDVLSLVRSLGANVDITLDISNNSTVTALNTLVNTKLTLVSTDGTMTGSGIPLDPLSVKISQVVGNDIVNNNGLYFNEALTSLSIAGNILTYVDEVGVSNTINLPASGSDNWGTQVIQSTNILSGDGTLASPLDIKISANANNIIVNSNGIYASETVTSLQLIGSDIVYTDESGSTNSIALPSSSSDNWGVQVVVSDNSLSGNGTIANPLTVQISADANNDIILSNGIYFSEKLTTLSLAGTDLLYKDENNLVSTISLASLSGGNTSVITPDANGSLNHSNGATVPTIVNIPGSKRIKPDLRSIAFQSTGADVSIVRALGSSLVTIPTDVDKLNSFELEIDAASGDQGGNSSYTIEFNYLGSRIFNQLINLSDAETPVLQILTYSTPTKLQWSFESFDVDRSSPGTLRLIIPNALPTPTAKRRLKFIF